MVTQVAFHHIYTISYELFSTGYEFFVVVIDGYGLFALFSVINRRGHKPSHAYM